MEPYVKKLMKFLEKLYFRIKRILMKKKRKRKNCPECRFWRFSRQSHSCSKNPERLTYTSLTLPDDIKDREWCTDMMKRKKK